MTKLVRTDNDYLRYEQYEMQVDVSRLKQGQCLLLDTKRNPKVGDRVLVRAQYSERLMVVESVNKGRYRLAFYGRRRDRIFPHAQAVIIGVVAAVLDTVIGRVARFAR